MSFSSAGCTTTAHRLRLSSSVGFSIGAGLPYRWLVHPIFRYVLHTSFRAPGAGGVGKLSQECRPAGAESGAPVFGMVTAYFSVRRRTSLATAAAMIAV